MSTGAKPFTRIKGTTHYALRNLNVFPVSLTLSNSVYEDVTRLQCPAHVPVTWVNSRMDYDISRDTCLSLVSACIYVEIH